MIKKEDSIQIGVIGVVILALLSLVWGSSFILIKRGLVAFSYDEVALLRIGISALAFFPFAIRALSRVERKDLKYILIVGVSGNFLPGFLFPLAQLQISSSVAGIINSITPLFTLILGVLFFNTSFKWSKLTGIFIGFLGVLLLIFFRATGDNSENIWYALFALLAAVCYATSVNTLGAYLKHVKSLDISSISFLMIGTPVVLYWFNTDIWHKLQTHPQAWESLGYLAILALLGTVLATLLFFYLVQRTNALFASTVAYLIPLVAVAWGALDGEAIGIFHIVAMALILLGVYLSKK